MSERTTGTERLWTAANVVTLVRICLIPVFVIAIISPWPRWFPQWVDADLWKPWVAAGVFIAIACTDCIDGYLARSRNEVTNFGKFMDPLADKILVAAALLALIELDVLPSWVALIILTREFIVSGIRMVAASHGVVIAASWYGKAKTVTQIIAIVLFIIKDSHVVSDVSMVLSDQLYLFAWAVMIVALALTIISMLDYFVKARELLGFSSSHQTKDSKNYTETSSDASIGTNELHEQTSSKYSSRDSAKVLPEETSSSLPVVGIVDVHSEINNRTLRALAAQTLSCARKCSLKLGTAESCTGGLIAGMLTAIPGSSDTVNGGIVSYSNGIKHAVLGVRTQTLDRYGAVSEETACEMARGARVKLSVDVAVSVTGIAGPGGAEPGKPIGTVWIGLSHSEMTYAKVFHFDGDRDAVRNQTVYNALLMVKNAVQSIKSSSETL